MQGKERKGYERGGNSPAIVLNSQLTCKDCIFVYSPDEAAGSCAQFDLKPNKVLDGGECNAKKTNKDI